MSSTKANKQSDFNPDSIKLRVDLLDAAVRQLDFLQLVDDSELLKDDSAGRQAARRYETVWIPLLARNSSQARLLKPPLDVAWAAHCHQLAPRAYRADITNLIGFIPDTQSPVGKSVTDTLARRLWQDANPGEPFDLKLEGGQASSASSYKCRLSYDICGAMQRQRAFYYNISLPHYRDAEFLKASLLRYKKFLRLEQLFPREFLVPCYDIDLMWHSHQLEPLAYHQDCLIVLNRTLDHDDSTTDRSEGSKLINGFERTSELWKEHFGESYARKGCMYRGHSPVGQLSPFNPNALSTGAANSNSPYSVSVTGNPGSSQVETVTSHTMKLSIKIGGQQQSESVFQTSHTNPQLFVPMCCLRLEPGDWVVAAVQDRAEKLWGPVPIGRVPRGEEHPCSAAAHRLVDCTTSKLMFEMRIINAKRMSQSVVQVFHADRMVVVAHLIGSEQLPAPTQVTKQSGIPSLNQKTKERGFLLKDSIGDWAVLLGQWTKDREVGHVALSLHRLRFGASWKSDLPKCVNFRLSREPGGQQKFSAGGVTVNFAKGRVDIESNCGEAPHLVATAFCAAILEVLCRPKQRRKEEEQTELISTVCESVFCNMTPEVRILGSPKPKAADARADLEPLDIFRAIGEQYLDWMPVHWRKRIGPWRKPSSETDSVSDDSENGTTTHSVSDVSSAAQSSAAQSSAAQSSAAQSSTAQSSASNYESKSESYGAGHSDSYGGWHGYGGGRSGGSSGGSSSGGGGSCGSGCASGCGD